MSTPRVCIIKTDGTNCDQETAYAFGKAGAHVEIVLLNHLKMKKQALADYQIVVIPGGFSYGDDIASGKILALELCMFLHEQLTEFIAAKKLILGICNGFQVLVRTGLLPFKQLHQMDVTLENNDSRKFECRWVPLKVEKSACVFTRSLQGQEITLPVAHGEGKFFCSQENLEEVEQQNLVALRYCTYGQRTVESPENPNGSLNAIAGICDSSGLLFGLMPHPERLVEYYQYPQWRKKIIPSFGLSIFADAVAYFE